MGTTASVPSSLTLTAQYPRPVYALPASERRLEPPRREGCRPPTLVRDEHPKRREFHEALLDADTFEDLAGMWQAAILEADQNRPDLRIVGSG
jgi:hypothetical protein